MRQGLWGGCHSVAFTPQSSEYWTSDHDFATALRPDLCVANNNLHVLAGQSSNRRQRLLLSSQKLFPTCCVGGCVGRTSMATSPLGKARIVRWGQNILGKSWHRERPAVV